MKNAHIWWRIALLCAGSAVITIVTFNLIGSTLDAQGVLNEPFFLIPLFWLLSFGSIISMVIAVVIRRTQ